MSCARTTAELLEYFEGDISPAARHAMGDHFRTCQACQHLVESYERTVELCRNALANAASAPPEALLAYLRQHCRS